MEKLDENYLDLVRESLYKKKHKASLKQTTKGTKNSNKFKHQVGVHESPKNTVKNVFKTEKETFKPKDKLQKRLKKKTKEKEVTFVDINELNINSPEDSSNKVKGRVPTPKSVTVPETLNIKNVDGSRDLNESQDREITGIISKQISPSLNENDRLTFYPSVDQNFDSDLKEVDKKNSKVKSKKRQLSVSDTPEVSVKRKKDKHLAKKGIRLVFDDSLDDSELGEIINHSPDIGHKEKIISKRKKIKNKYIKWEENLDTDLTVSTSLGSKTEPNPNNTKDNFIFSLTNDKNKGLIKKPRKKLKKIDVSKASYENVQNVDQNIELDNLYKSSSILEDSSVDKTNGLSPKKSDSKNKKIKKFKKKSLKIRKDKTSNENSPDSNNSLVDSDIEFKVRKHTRNSNSIVEDPAEFSDTYDNENVGVKGLKFQKFCNLFPPTHNEQFLGSSSAFDIPKKYFKISESDFDSEWQSEALSNSKSKEDSNIGDYPDRASKKLFQNNFIESRSTSDLNSTTKKNNQNNKINILDMKILNYHSPDSPNSPEDQAESQEEPSPKMDSQESFKETLNLNGTCENEIEDNLGDVSRAKILTLKNGSKIVALNLGHQIYFHGLCLLKVLNGELEVLGACMNKNSGEKKFYSPRGTALLYVRNKSTLYVDSLVKLKYLISEELLHENDVDLTFKQHYVIFLCSELKEPYIDFIEKYISQKIFPESNTPGPRVDFKLHGSWNKIQSSEKWEEVLENISDESKTIISGGKGVGKSTFLRYAVNFLLGRYRKLRVIDLDPGQSEFYSPGCISVVTVDKEVFGPNYTHLLKPDSLMLSHINMGYDIKKYLKSVRHLLESTKNMEILPTLINFPGFTQGIGLDIAAQSLKLMQPSLVIQINSKSSSKNYRVDLTADNLSSILKEENTLNQDESNDDAEFSYDFVKFDSLSESNEAWSLEARQAREMNILSYLSQMMSENVVDLTSTDVNMYSINISAVSITNAEGNAISPLAINANLVALCAKLNKHSDMFSCYGYGFIRGMDLQTDTLVLITPEPIETLENVSHLVLGSVTTPPSLVMTTGGVKGHIPYVSVGDPVDFGQFTKRSYLPPRK